MLASTTRAEYLGAEESAPNAKLQKNKIKTAVMPEKTNLTGLPQVVFTDLRRLSLTITPHSILAQKL